MVTMIVQLLIPTVFFLLAQVQCNPYVLNKTPQRFLSYDSNSSKIDNQYLKRQDGNTDNDCSPVIIVQGCSDIQIMSHEKLIDLMNDRRVLNYKQVGVQEEQPNLGVPSPINNGPIGPDTTFVPPNHEEITVVPVNKKEGPTNISLPDETKVKPVNKSDSNTEINKIVPDTINNGPDTTFVPPNHEEITTVVPINIIKGPTDISLTDETKVKPGNESDSNNEINKIILDTISIGPDMIFDSPNHEEITDKKQIDAVDANVIYKSKPKNVDVDEVITQFSNKEPKMKMKNTSQVLDPALKLVKNVVDYLKKILNGL